MKVWVLVFAAAVWMQMPSEGSAKHLAPTIRAVSPALLADISKRHNAEVKKRDPSTDEDESIRDFLESDEVKELLEALGVSLKEIDDLVDNDDDIEAEYKDLMKAILILSIAGGDISSPDFWADIQDRSIFKKK